MPLVIVISGLAGSGKSTLGEKLNKLQNVNVVEFSVSTINCAISRSAN